MGRDLVQQDNTIDRCMSYNKRRPQFETVGTRRRAARRGHRPRPMRPEGPLQRPWQPLGVFGSRRLALTLSLTVASQQLLPMPPAAFAVAELTAEQSVIVEAWATVQRGYVDQSFGGTDWKAVKSEYLKRKYKSMGAAREAVSEMLSLLGDRCMVVPGQGPSRRARGRALAVLHARACPSFRFFTPPHTMGMPPHQVHPVSHAGRLRCASGQIRAPRGQWRYRRHLEPIPRLRGPPWPDRDCERR